MFPAPKACAPGRRQIMANITRKKLPLGSLNPAIVRSVGGVCLKFAKQCDSYEPAVCVAVRVAV